MVDSNDRERVNEAREELMRMMAEDELRDAVFLVFANKQVRSLCSTYLLSHTCTHEHLIIYDVTFNDGCSTLFSKTLYAFVYTVCCCIYSVLKVIQRL